MTATQRTRNLGDSRSAHPVKNPCFAGETSEADGKINGTPGGCRTTRGGSFRPDVSAAGHQKRAAIKAWRQTLGSGEVHLETVFRERPDCFNDWAVLEVMRLGRRWGRERVSHINGVAVLCGVNLAERMTDARPETIAFAIKAANGLGNKVGLKTFAVEVRQRESDLTRRLRELEASITRHQRAIQDPKADADVAVADERLWSLVR